MSGNISNNNYANNNNNYANNNYANNNYANNNYANNNYANNNNNNNANISLLMERLLDNSSNYLSYSNDLISNDLSYNNVLITNELMSDDLSTNVLSFLTYNIFPRNYDYYNTSEYNDLAPGTYYTRRYSFVDFMRLLSQNSTTQEHTFLENFINSTFDNNNTKFKKVICDDELEKLKPQKFTKKTETETNCQCPILCYNFEENEEIIKLPCNHNFNCEAILKWLTQESNTCPVCRYEFNYKEINNDNKSQETNQETTHETSNTNYDEDFNNNNNIISEEELLLQEILLFSYSNNNSNNSNNSNTSN
jgi:hypothetical protein